jgi:hypothetical protein
MSYRSLAVIAWVGCIFFDSDALALGVTTQDCLDKGKCAYVDIKGHVTCEKCHGQFSAPQAVPATPWPAGITCYWKRGFFGAPGFVCP